ncbi:unnamed protein product [Closterium sp. NIES-54]
MATLIVLAVDADGRPFMFESWLAGLHWYLWRFLRNGVSQLEHTSGSLQAPTTPAEPAADAGKTVRRRYRADYVACTQWTERDAVAELAILAHMPSVQRTHFRQVTSAHTLYDAVLCEWAVRWGSPGGGAWGTSVGDVEAPGGVEVASPGACDSASTCVEPEEALHTFLLDSSASRCFFRDYTTITPLTALVPVTLANPSGGPIVAQSSTVLPCSTAPSGSLTGFHLPSFARNLVATAVLQNQFFIVIQPGGELVAICTELRTGEHLVTFT